MSKPREWWIEDGNVDGNRIFEINGDKIILEYRGKPPTHPIHVIEKSAYDRLARAVKIFIEYYGVKESQSAESKELIKALEGE